MFHPLVIYENIFKGLVCIALSTYWVFKRVCPPPLKINLRPPTHNIVTGSWHCRYARVIRQQFWSRVGSGNRDNMTSSYHEPGFSLATKCVYRNVFVRWSPSSSHKGPWVDYWRNVEKVIIWRRPDDVVINDLADSAYYIVNGFRQLEFYSYALVRSMFWNSASQVFFFFSSRRSLDSTQKRFVAL